MGLVITSAAISLSLLRQMEHDADRLEALLVGGDVVERSTRRIVELAFAQKLVLARTGRLLEQEGKAPEDIPLATSVFAREFEAHQRTVVEATLTADETLPFSTHPSHGTRIRRARELGAPGSFAVDRPAASMIDDIGIVDRDPARCERSSAARIGHQFA